MKDKKIFYGIPLVVLRKFVEMNKDYGDDFMQIFEIDPRFLFTEDQLPNLVSNGALMLDFNKLGGKDVD